MANNKIISKTVDVQLHIFSSPKFKSVVADALSFLESTPVHKLPPKASFNGVGVYLLYYNGPSTYYKNIAVSNKAAFVKPIYAGKAVPEGWRRARVPVTGNSKTLFRRLNEHANSINQCRGLSLKHFYCRFMILNGVESDLITAVEAELIRKFQPLWNSTIDGFGNHDPGLGRSNQAKSEWDILHPGRLWANKLTGDQIKRKDIIKKLK